MNTISKKALGALTFALSLLISSQPLMALALGDGNDREEIIINPDTMHNGGGHFRAPALVPICAAYLPHSSAIELEFLYNIGDVQVTLCSLTDGTQVTFTVSSATGTAIIPVPLANGPCAISFRTSTSVTYSGIFIAYQLNYIQDVLFEETEV